MREMGFGHHINDIRSYDEKGNNHGYFETYLWSESLWLRVNYVHGLETGYEEYHGIYITTFYIR